MMPKHSFQANGVQMCEIDNETREIIELINSYPFPRDFIHWLSDGIFEFKTLQQEHENGKFKRICQFHVKSSLVFTGRLEINAEKFPKEAVQSFTLGKEPFLSSDSITSKLRVDRHSRDYSKHYYTLISNILNVNEPVGVSWEIYELPQILEIYKNKKNSFRHTL